MHEIFEFRFIHFGGQCRKFSLIGAYGGALVRHASICSIGEYGGMLVRPLSICLIFMSVDVRREHAGLRHFRVGAIFAHRKVL